MFFNNNIKYRDILIFALIGVIGYKLIDNYDYFFSLLKKIVTIVTPFIYAIICAYILNPIVKFFEKILKKFKVNNRGISIAITYSAIIALVFVVLFFTIPSITDSILSMIAEVPRYAKVVQKWINAILQNERIKELIVQAGLLGRLQQFSNQIGDFAVDLLQGIAMYLLSFTSNLVNVVFGFLISIYVISDKEKLLKNARTITYMILKEKNGTRLINFVRTYNRMVGTYIGIKAIDSSIVGSIALVGLIIVGEPYAPLIALVVGIANMIPYFGPFIGDCIAVTVAVFISPMKAFIVFMLLISIQQFDAWFLEPRLVGKKVGISPLGIMMGVIIGGGFLGPIGMLLGSPTMATIKIYYGKLFNKFKDKHPNLVREELDEIS